MPTIYTIGHGLTPPTTWIRYLEQCHITDWIDARRYPNSPRNPFFNAINLATFPRYQHKLALTGRRPLAPKEYKSLWNHPSFNAYAYHAETSEAFAASVRALLLLDTPVVFCSEVLWWKCHRRVIADYLLAHGASVKHIVANGSYISHRLTEGAKIVGEGKVSYLKED